MADALHQTQIHDRKRQPGAEAPGPRAVITDPNGRNPLVEAGICRVRESLLTAGWRRNELRVGLLVPRVGGQERSAGRQAFTRDEREADEIRQLLDRAALIRQREWGHQRALINTRAPADLWRSLPRESGWIEPSRRRVVDTRHVRRSLEAAVRAD